jgi:LuxR family transcriptional regulator, maltose regulon positive regulatory protein
MTPEALVRIYLFEPVRVQVAERVAIDEHFTRRKAKALFVYLFMNRGRHISKYQLLADLWPEAEHAQPGRVKHTVQILRAALEGQRPTDGWQIIQELGGAYFFNAAVSRYSDCEDFEAQLQAAREARHAGDTASARHHYRRAIELHRGAFLAEFRYDDWAAAEIARLHELYLVALEESARLEAAEGAYAHAVELLRAAVLADPLHESSSVELMRSLWLDGRRTEALRVYHRLRDVLATRLDVEPLAQTTRLYEAIRRDQAVAV